MTQVEVTSDGWVVDDLRYFLIMVGHPPPRPYGYWDQITEDAGSWKVIALWLAGFGSIAIGVAFGWWLLIPFGLYILFTWARLCRLAVRGYRDAVVTPALIDALYPHPLMHNHLTADAKVADGRVVPVTADRALVESFVNDGGGAEVLFLDESDSQFCLVIGARALPRDRGDQPAGPDRSSRTKRI